jgi:hypothetical protein
MEPTTRKAQTVSNGRFMALLVAVVVVVGILGFMVFGGLGASPPAASGAGTTTAGPGAPTVYEFSSDT